MIVIVEFSKSKMENLIKNNVTKGTYSSIREKPIRTEIDGDRQKETWILSQRDYFKLCKDVEVFKKKTDLDLSLSKNPVS